MDLSKASILYIDDEPRTVSPGAARDIAALIEQGWVIADRQKFDVGMQKDIEALREKLITRHKNTDEPTERNMPSGSYLRDTYLNPDDINKFKYIVDGVTLIRPDLIDRPRFIHPNIYEWPKRRPDILLNEYEFTLKEEKSVFNYLTEAAKVQAIIRSVYRDHSQLYKINPFEFENMIAELLRDKDFEVELTKRTRDGGYDILALQSVAGIPLRFLVECKRYAAKRPIDVNIVRSFGHVVSKDGANKGLIFTTSYFTKDAIKLREKDMPYLLDFKDNGDIIDWVAQYSKK